ncbi:MAG TPA: hypothetical protein VFK12_03035 [Gammaproteobacteria bacterium]|nr:hypothetical protein [Gammaproteobacteria bacterium]
MKALRTGYLSHKTYKNQAGHQMLKAKRRFQFLMAAMPYGSGRVTVLCAVTPIQIFRIPDAWLAATHFSSCRLFPELFFCSSQRAATARGPLLTH